MCKEVGQLWIHHVLLVADGSKPGELDALCFDVGTVRPVVEDVVACAAHHNGFQHTVAYLFHNMVHFGHKHIVRQGVALTHQLFVAANPVGEGAGDVTKTFDGAVAGILEQQQLVADVHRGVVVGRGGEQQHLLAQTLHTATVGALRFADALQVLVARVAVVAEVVRLVDDDHIVFAWFAVVVATVAHLVKATAGDEPGVLVNLESLEGTLPFLEHRRGHDDEDAGIATILHDETLGYHRGNRRLAETHHVGNEASVVAQHCLVALRDGVALVAEVAEAIACGIEFEIVLHHRAKSVDQHLHIQLVRRRRPFAVEVGRAACPLHIVDAHRHTFLPQMPELIFAETHVVVVLQRHV